jgi:hypothetical protein
MKLSDRLHLLLLQAVKAAGSFDPNQSLHYVEEQMALEEAQLAKAFLQWVTDNKRQFGHGTVRDVWRDWQLTLTGNVTPKVKVTDSHDLCRVNAKFPSGGVLRLTITRAGETLTLGGSSDPYVAKSQQQTVAEWVKPVTPEETIKQRLERVAAFMADCLSVDHLVRKIRNLDPAGV